MKITDILDRVKELGFNVALGRFTKPQTAPFAIIRADQSQNLYDDQALLRRKEDYIIEFYYHTVQNRLDFEDAISKEFIWQRYTADVAITDDKTVLMAGYNLIGDNYEHFDQ